MPSDFCSVIILYQPCEVYVFWETVCSGAFTGLGDPNWTKTTHTTRARAHARQGQARLQLQTRKRNTEDGRMSWLRLFTHQSTI
jgi:hypothetical protein